MCQKMNILQDGIEDFCHRCLLFKQALYVIKNLGEKHLAKEKFKNCYEYFNYKRKLFS